MKNWIKSNAFRTAAIWMLAVALIAGASIRTAWSYFTTYATAKGGYIIHLGDRTEIEEDVSNWQKHLKIKSEADSEPVFVRARAYCGEAYELQYSGNKWSPAADGWYYYSDVVYGGGVTEELVVTIKNVPEDVEPGTDFNVVVVYESTPVLYDAEGNPYADWTAKVDTGE